MNLFPSVFIRLCTCVVFSKSTNAQEAAGISNKMGFLNIKLFGEYNQFGVLLRENFSGGEGGGQTGKTCSIAFSISSSSILKKKKIEDLVLDSLYAKHI